MAGDGVPYKSFVVHHSLSLWWQGGLFRLGERYRGKRVFSPYWFLLPENKTFFFSLLSTICQVRGITTVHSRAVRRKNKISNWNFQNKRKEEETKKKQEKKSLRGGGTFIYDSSKSCPNLFALLHPVFDVLASSKFYFTFCFFSSSGCFIIVCFFSLFS